MFNRLVLRYLILIVNILLWGRAEFGLRMALEAEAKKLEEDASALAPPEQDTKHGLRVALLTVLDQVDYIAGVCAPTEMVGACLPMEIIEQARDALAASEQEKKRD